LFPKIELRNPKEADFTYLAFVSFSKPEEGLAACTGIDHSFVMNNEVVSMKADLKSFENYEFVLKFLKF
jgi:hypothetical protein